MQSQTSTLLCLLFCLMASGLSAQFAFSDPTCDLDSPANATNSNPTFAASIVSSGDVEPAPGDQVGIFNSSDELLGVGVVQVDNAQSPPAFAVFQVSAIASRVGACPAFVNGETVSVLLFDISSGDTIAATNGMFQAVSSNGLVTGFDETEPFSFSISVPITLSAFTATALPKEAIRLDWTSNFEDVASHYEVERSQDGTEWNAIERLEAANQGSAIVDYQLIDDKAAPGTNYYRLRMVDLDGTYAYSPVVTAELRSADAKVTIAPNPAFVGGEVSIRLNQNWNVEATTGSLHAVTGRQVAKWAVTRLNDSFTIPAELPAGVYLLRLSDGQQEQTRRLIVR